MVDVPRTGALRPVPVALTGLALTAVGLVARWVADPGQVVAGLVVSALVSVVVTSVAVWLDRRSPRAATAAVLMATWLLVSGLWEGDLVRGLGSGNAGIVLGTAVLIVGLLLGLAGGALGLVGAVPPGVRLPRRLPRLVAAGGMLADAIGDALPEGLHPDGPGPLLFLVLAVAVAAVPARAVVGIAGLLSLSLLAGGVAAGEFAARFADPSAGPVFAGAVLQLVGLVVAVTATVVALWPTRRGTEDRCAPDAAESRGRELLP